MFLCGTLHVVTLKVDDGSSDVRVSESSLGHFDDSSDFKRYARAW